MLASVESPAVLVGASLAGGVMELRTTGIEGNVFNHSRTIPDASGSLSMDTLRVNKKESSWAMWTAYTR